MLRFILDTHPALACPPETGMGGVCTHLNRFLGVLDGTAAEAPPGHGAISADAEAAIVQLLRDSYGSYVARRGKRRWCDKSLDNVLYADLLATIFPDAQFLCLVRHCMDVVASGVEACSWGLHGFGFDSFSAQFPGNSVAAIAAYWAENIKAILEFEKDYPGRCHRIRYEDLIADPERVTAGVFQFLGEPPVPGITEACFRAEHEATGPGDEKIWFTGQVEERSVGRGVAVPADMIPPPLREHVNGLLGELGYRVVDQDWNRAAGPMDPRVLPLATRAAPAGAGPGASSPLLAEVAGLAASRSGPGLPGRQAEVSRRWPRLAGQTLRVLIMADGQQREIGWRIPAGWVADGDGHATGAGPAVSGALAGDAKTWRAVLTGAANMAVALRSGQLRWSGDADRTRLFSDEVLAIGLLLGLSEVRSAVITGPGTGNGQVRPEIPAAKATVPDGPEW